MLYDSIMWKYIAQEEELLKNTLINREPIYFNKETKAIYIVAHGSSYNAAVAIKPLISKLCKIDVQVFTPDNFTVRNENISISKDEIVIGISQTGTSAGVLKAIEKVKGKCKIYALTAVKDSPIHKLSDETILIKCGEEDSNAKTKGYSLTLLNLMLFALDNALEHQNIDNDEYQSALDDLINEISLIDKIKGELIHWCEDNKFGLGMSNEYVIGSGINYGTALEGQLKMMETLRVPTMFNDIVEFSHGMHRSINEYSYLILINVGSNEERDLFEKTFKYMQNITKHCIMINVSNQSLNDSNVINIPLFKFDDSILLTTLVIQVISTFVPEINDLDPNACANNEYTDVVATRV